MTENIQYIAGLIGKHLENSLNAEEDRILEEWIHSSENNRILFEEITDQQQLTANLQRFYAYDSDRISAKIREQVPAFSEPARKPATIIYRKWKWAAAAAVILLAGSTWLLVTEPAKPPVVAATEHVTIAPGKQGAILTLADGREVVLDSLGNGVIAQQSGTSVVLSNGQLIYDPAKENSGVQYNQMTTPKGRQFRVTLPDGTKVWLNAASSIRYPTVFAGNERKVEVFGEACFEVAKDAGKPFFVTVNNKAEISVLGTLFNVNAYENEGTINTTLLNGSVKVAIPSSAKTDGVILKPGQQARIGMSKAAEEIQVINNEDLEKIMAWKNGLFNFEGAHLEEVMRQLERWYNIDVVYENGIPDIRFLGEMSRQIALADLLEILRRTEVDFRIEGRKLIVLNK